MLSRLVHGGLVMAFRILRWSDYHRPSHFLQASDRYGVS
jgi:hypothetical protein